MFSLYVVFQLPMRIRIRLCCITTWQVRIEGQRLCWFRNNQDKLRADSYLNVQTNARNGTVHARETGRRVVLPSGFT